MRMRYTSSSEVSYISSVVYFGDHELFGATIPLRLVSDWSSYSLLSSAVSGGVSNVIKSISLL